MSVGEKLLNEADVHVGADALGLFLAVQVVDLDLLLMC